MAKDVLRFRVEIVPPRELVANDDHDSTKAGEAVTTDVLANDLYGDVPVKLSELVGPPTVFEPPAHGEAVPNADGTITYTPAPGFEGQDSYVYEIVPAQTGERWVPVTSTGVTLTLDEPSLGGVELQESTITGYPPGPPGDQSWSVTLSEPREIRVNITDFESNWYANSGSFLFTLESGEQEMIDNEGGGNEWLPNPVVPSGPVTEITYFPGETSDYAQDRYTMMIEVAAPFIATVTVDVEPAARISYNCECEDPSRPKATLAELRQKLFARLGFTDPQGDAPPRTLGDMVNELLVRLGRAGNAARGNLAPGVFDLMASFVRDAQESLWHEYELGQTGEDQALKPLVDPEDTTTLDSWAVFNMALGLAKAHYGAKDAEVYLNRVNKYIADRMKRGPVGSTQLANSFLHSAQTFLFDKVASFRQSRYYRWPLEAGVRFYDFDGNDDECGKKMVPETVEWVGVSEGPEGNDRWRELWCGIEPTLYTGGIRNSMPQRYEMRQCIEVWPAPDGREAYLRVKAKFGLSRFTEDDDETTIDPELVLLQALAMAKAHYNHPDASSYAGMVQSRIGDITAGSHHTRRYIPGHEVRHAPLPPRPRDGFIEN